MKNITNCKSLDNLIKINNCITCNSKLYKYFGLYTTNIGCSSDKKCISIVINNDDSKVKSYCLGNEKYYIRSEREVNFTSLIEIESKILKNLDYFVDLDLRNPTIWFNFVKKYFSMKAFI